MNYLKKPILYSVVYILLLSGSILLVDIFDNKNDKYDFRADESDKMLILEKRETYQLHEGEIILVLVSILNAPLNSIMNIFSGFYFPKHGYESQYIIQLGIIEIIMKFLLVITYILIPVSWIILTVRFFKHHTELGKIDKRFLKLLFFSTFILGILLSSLFWVKLTFENFKGFF